MTGFIRKTLPELLFDTPIKITAQQSLPAVPITGIVYDSRQAQPGNLFVALQGGNTDGHNYIPKAIENGAAAVMGTLPLQDLPVPYLQVEDARFAMAYISASFYGFPARRMTVVGVTGTDGKTTTSNLIYQIMLAAGLKAGIISTVNAVIGDEVVDTGFHVTTPEAPEVQHYLQRMLVAGLTHVVVETTSHGLAQHRVTGCEFDIAAVTNITHEHLDYHGTYEAYRAAKARLFTGLSTTANKKHGNPRLAVLNRDDSSYEYLQPVISADRVSYGHENQEADIRAEDIQYDHTGLHFTAVGTDFRMPIKSRLVGAHNISNCLAAIAVAAIGLKIPLEAVQAGIEGMRGIPGRAEQIDMGQNFIAMVDFAHTPNALKMILKTARQITSGRVITVFGSAGLRDRQKRRMMPEVAMELADFSILTAEDPRTESLADILVEMSDAARGRGGLEGQNFWAIPDRGTAIQFALTLARPGDVVVACGKGHEQSMCFGQVEYPWDERVAMRAALAKYLGVPGPQMPYLPTQDQVSIDPE